VDDFELLFVDETTFSLNYPLRNCWMRRGQQKTITAFSGKRQYLHVIGAYNWCTDQVTCLDVERKNSDTFIEFLEKLLVEVYPSQTVVLVMDNASYHYSAKVQAVLSLFEHRVHVFWLPQYCPELNLIERFWLHLKQTAWANKLYLSLQSLRHAVHQVLHQQNEPSCLERLTFSKFFR
jgi:putative transposase